MTIYGWKHSLDGDIVTIVSAADVAAELDAWWQNNFEEGATGEHYTMAHLTEPLEHLFDDDLKPFRKPLMIFTHSTVEQRDGFFGQFGFEEVRSAAALDRQEDMIYNLVVEAEKNDTRTIAEVTGTVDQDRWDQTPTEADVMMAKPAGVTGHGAGAHGGEGALKKTREQIEADAKKASANDSVIVRGVTVDEDGNVDVDIAVLDEREQEQVRKMREEARQEELKKEQAIRERAAEAGIDADQPHTVTAVESDGTVVQHNSRLGITVTVTPKGKRLYRDAETGAGLAEDQLERLTKRREAEAQIRDIEAEEQAEQEAKEKAEREAEEAKSDLRKKMEQLTRGGSTIQEKSETPEERFTNVIGEISQSLRDVPAMDLVVAAKDMFDAGELSAEIFRAVTGISEEDSIPEPVAVMPIHDVMAQHVAPGSITEDSIEQHTSTCSPTQARKLRRLLAELDHAFKKLDPSVTQPTTINRQKQKKSAKPANEYYFAVVPPGELGTDEVSAILGQEAFVIFMPKANFDAGELPLQNGGWFSTAELANWENKTGTAVEEIQPSVYKIMCNVGDAVRHFNQTGATENGKLLISIGVDVSNIPFDWPYHYHATGARVTDNELRMRAARILQIAREQGVVLQDEDGTVTDSVAGVNHAAIAKTQQDVTAGVKQALGASGTTEDSRMDCDLYPIVGSRSAIEAADLPSEVRALVSKAVGYDVADDFVVPVGIPEGMPFLRIDGTDLYALPCYGQDGTNMVQLAGVTNMEKVKGLLMGGNAAVTIYKKVDNNKSAAAVYTATDDCNNVQVLAL
ncbi:MAG: hypothetical protein HC836_16540 [Richelia sp. RM2_1_2]|nr:hypothetical protein [Richelia sp. RM2_1_2]